MATDPPPIENRREMNPAAVLLDNRRWLWVVIYSRLGDAAATEDVLQEVSVAAVRSQSDFDETCRTKSWLYRVAVRQVMLLRRSQHRDQAKLRRYSNGLPTSSTQSCVDWLCNDESTTQLQQALTQLQPSDQQVLILKYNEDYSCREIADLLGVTETTIQTRLLRARKRLRQLLVTEYKFEE